MPDFSGKHASPATKGSSSTTAGSKDPALIQALAAQKFEEEKKSISSGGHSLQDHPVGKHSSKGLADLIAESRNSGMAFHDPKAAAESDQ